MTDALSMPAPPADQIPPYCRTCRRALHSRTAPGGDVCFIHTSDLRGGTTDHPAQPVPLSQISDPIMECDFCSRPDAAFVYVCADLETDTRIFTSRTVGVGEYRDRHRAARTLGVETTAGPVQVWGRRWTACSGCGDLIEARDLYGLIFRVTEAMPAKYTRGTKLPQVRGALHATYSTVLATLAPGRGRITPGHPLGVWESTPASEPSPAAGGTDSPSTANR